MGRQRQHLAALHLRDLRPERLQQRAHRLDIRQARRVGQGQRLFAEQRGGHQRETRVLGPRDRDLPLERAIARDDDRIHLLYPFSLSPFSGLSASSAPRARICALRRARLAFNAVLSLSSRLWPFFAGLSGVVFLFMPPVLQEPSKSVQLPLARGGISV